MRLCFAFTEELISCMKRLCNIPAGQIITNSAATSPMAVEKDKGLTEAFLAWDFCFLNRDGE